MCISYKNTAARVTYKNTVASIVTCRQDGRGRSPDYWASSPNVAQTHNENPNKVRMFMWFLYEMNIFKQYNDTISQSQMQLTHTQKKKKRSAHLAVPRTESASEMYLTAFKTHVNAFHLCIMGTVIVILLLRELTIV